MKNECQIVDLYDFLRKVLEKYNWDCDVAYKLLDEYDRVKAIDDADLELLIGLFRFPEKFWKVINQYYNAGKAWIPSKNVEEFIYLFMNILSVKFTSQFETSLGNCDNEYFIYLPVSLQLNVKHKYGFEYIKWFWICKMFWMCKMLSGLEFAHISSYTNYGEINES